MEDWRKVWRLGIAPQLSRAGLAALLAALEADDARLIQGQTTLPVPMSCVKDWPVESACAVAFCGWQGGTARTVEACEVYFGDVCAACDCRLGAPAACRFFLNWFDETPRDAVRAALIPEVRYALGTVLLSDAKGGDPQEWPEDLRTREFPRANT